jgi:insertion element IS1 protein InsB
VVKNGTTRNRKQKYLCRSCRRQFITDYTYQGCRSEVRRLIVPMTLNGSGIRDISRVLEVSINTVLKVIRAEAMRTPEPHPPPRATDVEVDEMWSFVEKKKNQSWLWHDFSPKTRQVIGYVRGRRTNAVLSAQLLAKLAPCQVTRFYTDWWDSYQKLIPRIGIGSVNLARSASNVTT